jgi:hypothetical protein
MFNTGTRRHPRTRDVVHGRSACRRTVPYTHAEADRRPLVRSRYQRAPVRGTFGPRSVPRAAIACAGRPHRLQPLARRAARPMPLPPYYGHATVHTVACFLGAQEDLPAVLSLAIKAGHRPSRAGAQRCQAAIAAVFVPTVNPWLRPLSPQTRAAPTSTRPPCSSHAR